MSLLLEFRALVAIGVCPSRVERVPARDAGGGGAAGRTRALSLPLLCALVLLVFGLPIPGRVSVLASFPISRAPLLLPVATAIQICLALSRLLFVKHQKSNEKAYIRRFWYQIFTCEKRNREYVRVVLENIWRQTLLEMERVPFR